MKYIDSHAHIFSKNGTSITNARYRPDYNASVDEYLAHLDKHDLTYGVLIQPSFFGIDNSEMLNAVAKANGRLKAVVVVPNDIDYQTLEQYATQGVCGIRLNLFGLDIPDVQNKQWQCLVSYLEQLGWHIELHCPPSYFVSLLPALSAYKVPVVIDHLGRPDKNQAIDSPDYVRFLSLLNPNQHWLKFSGLYRLGTLNDRLERACDIYQRLKEQGMLKQLVWGSDWPHTQHEHETNYASNYELFRKIVSNDNERHLILSENPSRLFGF